MTRINIIPPSELSNQHLMAEYREIFMVPASLKRTLNSKEGYLANKVSKKYTLNKGHVYFFYNKLLYLRNRYSLLVNELKQRGYKLDDNRLFPDDLPKQFYKDWKPSEEEQLIAKERINWKIQLKPNWYKFEKNRKK